jgi:hypothetical protein
MFLGLGSFLLKINMPSIWIWALIGLGLVLMEASKLALKAFVRKNYPD